MNLTRFIRDNRPAVMLATLVAFCLVSLGVGAEATFVHDGLRRAVALTAYPFLRTKLTIENSADYALGLVLHHDRLRDDNRLLREEVALLKVAATHRAELHDENERLRRMLGFMRAEPRLSLEPVRVIANLKGTLTIDRGRLHGIEEAMCVISPDGVVGVVTEVGDFSAIVATLHHRDCRIGAMVRRNRIRAYDGVVHASGSDLNVMCTMEYIDMKEDVRVGDEVVTSPESLFPSGFPIGRISRVIDTDSLWKRAEVAPAVDPYRLDEVFVVRRAAESLEDLAGPPSQGPALRAPELPDERPVQERFAP